MESSELADYKKAGEITAEALAYGKSLIKVDASMLDVVLKVEKKIRELGGEPAFPAQISNDNIAAHWCPDLNSVDKFTEGQLVKLDIGTHINGHVADTAISIDLSDDKKHEALIKAATEARDTVLKLMKPGMTLGEIGSTIQQSITDSGFSPVRNLSGHGLEQFEVHTWPSIPNYDTGDNTELEENMVVAVEPFATPGQGKVYEQEVGNIYSVTDERPIRGTYARKVLKAVEEREGLPFCLHWLEKKLGAGAKFGIRELQQNEIIETYPPLLEVSGEVVSQAEHSVIIRDKPIVYTRI